MQVPLTTTALHCNLCACPRSSCGIAGDLTALLWEPDRDPTALLSESKVTAFVLCLLKVCAVTQCSMRSYPVYWWCHCIAAAMLANVMHAPQCFAFSWMPWDPCENATLAWQVLLIVFLLETEVTKKQWYPCVLFNLLSGGSNREDQEVASLVSPAETPCSETSSFAHDATDISAASSVSSERSERSDAERSDADTVVRRKLFSSSFR